MPLLRNVGCPTFARRLTAALAITTLIASSASLVGPRAALAATDRSALPPEALALLKRLPNETLSVDLVLSQAMKTSDSFRIVRSQMISVPVAQLRSEAALDPQLTLSGGRITDENQPINPFSPDALNVDQASIILSKYFSTGTRVDVGMKVSDTEVNFDNPAFPDSRGVESAAELRLTQNLWKDAFGKGTRAGLEAGDRTRAANERAFEESAEEWALGLLGLFYRARLLQAQVTAAEEALARRVRLHDITRLKLERGTAERPDLLQTEETVLRAELGLREARQLLSEEWRRLVTALKLPDSWLRIDPMLVPIAFDDPVPAALNACGAPASPKPAPAHSTSTRRAELQAEAARALEERARSLSYPSLAILGGLVSNGVDTETLSPTFDDTFAVKNPEWTLQLQFQMPFGASAEKANLREATANLERTDAQASIERSDLLVGWINTCANLHRLQRNLNELEEAVKRQNQRARLEEERFRLGRMPLINVIEAGEAATQVELSHNQAAANVRQTAWQIARYEGRLTSFLKRLAEKPVELKP